jgi:hypothetical protein
LNQNSTKGTKMAITNTWSIVALDVKPTVGSLTDYVVTSHWTLSATDGTYTGYVYGTASFSVDPTKPGYTPYADLTEAEVIAWTQGALGAEQVAAYEANVAAQIENQINPPIITPPLPWAPSATTSTTDSATASATSTTATPSA